VSATPGRIDRSAFFLLVVLATALAVWLRTYGITSQVLLDDEWHAVHKLLSSTYGNIFKTFGVADHSIPLTLLYKAMADTVGLAEGRIRAVQIACGIALVPLGAWLAWRAGGDRPAAALFAFLVCGAPFLVMWSRFARPYAITLLLSIACLASIWRWRTHRSVGPAACAVVTAALSTWLHPITGVYPAIACVFVFIEDARAPAGVQPRPSRGSLGLGLAVATAMALVLTVPLYHDRQSLAAKAGGDQPGWDTIERMLAITWGGLPTPLVAAACLISIWGLAVLWRRDCRLAFYLLLLAIVPGVVIALSGAMWVHGGQNFLRYQLPLLPIVLFFGSLGAIDIVRRVAANAAAWIAAAVLSAAYLAATPAIEQVATLGPWYAHIGYHWDYRYRGLIAMRNDPAFVVPAFYRKLEAMPRGSVPVIEAPFEWAAPTNLLALYATYHRQPEKIGMIHDLCVEGPRIGEVPPDRRFRFRNFVFLNDVDAVRRTGARYLIFDRGVKPHMWPAFDADACIEKLARLYGPPAEIDERLAVFDLRQ